MKILVYGAGVIGTLYAARLQEGNHRVTVVARGQRLADIRRYGLAPSIANPMFDEAHQPRLADLVEKGLDVAIEHPVYAPPADPERERIQRW